MDKLYMWLKLSCAKIKLCFECFIIIYELGTRCVSCFLLFILWCLHCALGVGMWQKHVGNTICKIYSIKICTYLAKKADRVLLVYNIQRTCNYPSLRICPLWNAECSPRYTSERFDHNSNFDILGPYITMLAGSRDCSVSSRSCAR